MIPSSEFFEAFDEAGFLKPASWTPSAGGASRTAQVRYRAPTVDILNDAVRAVDHDITYVTAQLPGLTEGEVVTVGGVAFKVRQPPEALLDGSVSRAILVQVIS